MTFPTVDDACRLDWGLIKTIQESLDRSVKTLARKNS